jgi:hypothetical protein
MKKNVDKRPLKIVPPMLSLPGTKRKPPGLIGENLSRGKCFDVISTNTVQNDRLDDRDKNTTGN